MDFFSGIGDSLANVPGVGGIFEGFGIGTSDETRAVEDLENEMEDISRRYEEYRPEMMQARLKAIQDAFGLIGRSGQMLEQMGGTAPQMPDLSLMGVTPGGATGPMPGAPTRRAGEDQEVSPSFGKRAGKDMSAGYLGGTLLNTAVGGPVGAGYGLGKTLGFW